MYTQPEVVRRKYERELAAFKVQATYYRERGVWLLEESFPSALFAMVAINNKPFPIVPFGVVVDFKNYDLEPLSLTFVNPMTKAPLKLQELASVERNKPGATETERFLNGWSPDDDKPFLCLQGVREYHSNPGHTGDSWWLHRGTGAGRLGRILDFLARFGSEPIIGLMYQMQPVGLQRKLAV